MNILAGCTVGLTCMNNVNSLILLIQDKVPRMCAYSASGSSDDDSDSDYGDNGFGAGRGKLVKAMKSATPGNARRAPGNSGRLSLG